MDKEIIAIVVLVGLLLGGLLGGTYAFKAQEIACFKDHQSRPAAELKLLCS